MPLTAHGGGYFIEFDDGPNSGRAVLDMTIAPVMRHVTLRWYDALAIPAAGRS